MKPEKRQPMDFSAPVQPVVEPDNDLEWPDLAPAPSVVQSVLAEPPEPGPLLLKQAVTIPSETVASKPGGAWVWWLAGLGSLLWLALSVAAIGYQWPPNGPPVDFQPYQIAIFAVFAITPIGFIWLCAFCASQGLRLAAEARQTRALAQDMLQPAALAAAQAGGIVEQIRGQIAEAAAVAGKARAELTEAREGLVGETDKLVQAAEDSRRAAQSLGQQLAHERDSFTGLTSALEGASQSVTEAIARQTRLVAEASDLAQAQIGEAEAALAARAADLAGAAGDAGEAARLASEDLARQAARLETATIGVGDQIRSMEDTLTQQRAALVQVAHSVRADHEDISIQIETQRMQLTETLATTQTSIADLNESAAAAARSVGELAGGAAGEVRELADTIKAERDLLAASALQSLGAISEAAKFERESAQTIIEQTLTSMADTAERERAALDASVLHGLAELADAARSEREALQEGALKSVEAISLAAESARKLAEGHSNAARAQLEELGETAFAASQKAEAAFQARLKDANDLIARSSDLVEQAGAKVTERLEQSAAKARVMLTEVETAMADFEARIAGLPEQTQARAEELKASLAASFGDLLASARAAAEETQAIDAAFQDRVRRNYEMLSEAVRLMGVVSGRPGAAAASAAPAPRPPPPRPESEQPRAPTLPIRRAVSAETRPEPAPAPGLNGLRPRLKLAPTSADANVSHVFEGAGEPAGESSGGWTWQELLSSMDDASVEEGQLVDRLIGEIEGLGVDSEALLPPARIEEIAAAWSSDEAHEGRNLVRHLAPAAVRRLSRRTLAEPGLRAHAERYVKSYAVRLDEAVARKGRGGQSVSGLLAAEEGRAYLLFDAALGDQR
jgi:hypothetical protein